MAAETFKAKFEEEISKFKQLEKDREKYISNRQQLESQLTENKLVKEVSFHSHFIAFFFVKSHLNFFFLEFDLLEEDAKVYKLIGAVLIKQDLEEAKANVGKRLEYINAEIRRIEDNLEDHSEKSKKQKEKLMAMQESFKRSQGQ